MERQSDTWSRTPRHAFARGPWRHLAAIAAASVAWVCFGTVIPISGAPDRPAAQESEMKAWRVIAGYLFNFSKEAVWPDEDALPEDAPLLIGLPADRESGNEIARSLAGRLVGRHPVQVVQGNAPEDFSACRIIFVEEPDAARRMAAAYAGQPKLIVAYSPLRFTGTGCSIELVVDDQQQIRWVLNTGAIKAQGIEPSKRLWNLALDRRKGPVPNPPPRGNDTRKDHSGGCS